jgi:hypothetical protein
MKPFFIKKQFKNPNNVIVFACLFIRYWPQMRRMKKQRMTFDEWLRSMLDICDPVTVAYFAINVMRPLQPVFSTPSSCLLKQRKDVG